eukprot:5846408-Pyramimonas_sp.AAC.1
MPWRHLTEALRRLGNSSRPRPATRRKILTQARGLRASARSPSAPAGRPKPAGARAPGTNPSDHSA